MSRNAYNNLPAPHNFLFYLCNCGLVTEAIFVTLACGKDLNWWIGYYRRFEQLSCVSV